MGKNQRFLDYADRTKRTVFAPHGAVEDDQLFSASLDSINAHIAAMPQSYRAGSDHAYQSSFGFVESGLPNAFADEADGQFVTGIHTGLVVTIHEFSLFCFAQSSFQRMIGQPDKEVSPKAAKGMPPGVTLLLASIKADQDKQFLDRFVMPQCPHRTAAAHYLTLLMLRFVWLHEAAHGLLGHIEYLKARKALMPMGLNELHMDELVPGDVIIDNRILQCMEFEADSWALAKSIGIQRDGVENVDGIAVLPFDLRIRLTLFGIYAMTWLMETLASTAKRGRLNITHPAPIRRMQMLQNMAVWELNDLGIDAASVARDALKQFQDILSQMGSQWLQTDKFDPVNYRAVFESMRDDLEPYRYVSVA